jgi:hypothetical protein
MIQGSRFIHLRRRDHPVDLEKKESLVVLRRGTKNNNVRDARGMATKREYAKTHFRVILRRLLLYFHSLSEECYIYFDC